MIVTFYASDKPRELMLAAAIGEGIRNAGHDFRIDTPDNYSPSECAIFFAVKGSSRRILQSQLAHGGHAVYLDKGYTRKKGRGSHTEYTRVVVNDYGPGRYMMLENRPDDRLLKLGMHMSRRRKVKNGHILYCGSTQKYHDFHDIADCDTYARTIFEACKTYWPNREIIYRPKPGMRVPEKFPYIRISKGTESLHGLFEGCHVVVTHGATSAMEAVLAGVPTICAPQCIAAPVSASWQKGQPLFPSDDLRYQWASNAAYCEWTLDELCSGEAWAYIQQECGRVR